ncbi:hypothetical protein Cantr_00899 [Candida viswanathii]|uniref:Serine aminopeptidase S33 domain-containing protein n=1 Tax=Candida viswanathii TaxID=5486 RepID=A0A367YH17_9ASCO|nr:hypothetical protein Cantr_00899 [Candida viswanathii]
MSLTAEQVAKYQGLGQFFVKGLRTPVLRRPDSVGLTYEDVFFPSYDGVRLEGWFIPKEGSNKLIICNHFMPGNRYGYPGHLQPWDNFGGFEVNFMPQYKALHDAGYNVLCYDIRNHGLSDDANGRIGGIGQLEYRDVIGSIQYAKLREDTKDMDVGLLSICLGANSTIIAMDKNPEFFKDVKAMVALQPISISAFVENAAERDGIDVEEAKKVTDEEIQKVSGFHLDEYTPLPSAKSVVVPTKVMQLKGDKLTKVADAENIYKAMSSKEKEFFWMEPGEDRFVGYTYLGKHPEPMLSWFAKYV